MECKWISSAVLKSLYCTILLIANCMMKNLGMLQQLFHIYLLNTKDVNENLLRLVCEMKQIFQKRCLISSLGKFWWVYIKPQECDFLCVCCPGFDCISRAGPNALLGTVSSFVLVKARRKSKADLALKNKIKTTKQKANNEQTKSHNNLNCNLTPKFFVATENFGWAKSTKSKI